jgi:hypothetical protein
VESHLRGYSKNVPPEYIEFAVCREMGWTYTQLYEQPTGMVEYTIAFINAERKEQERRSKSTR